MNNDNNMGDELPKLNIEQENEFKKLKLNLEFGMDFSKNSNPNIPPEIEGQFLDYVSNFENAFQNAKQISVYKKIGSPKFKSAATLSDAEITVALERIEEIMQQNNLTLDVLADYENENRLIYTFITEELFLHEIDDMDVPGMLTHFIYEEFYPNHKYDLERETENFLKMFFNTKSDFYTKYHSKDALNHEELNNFRSLFKKFKLKLFDLKDITFNEKKAKATFNISFSAKIKGSDSKILYTGEGSITFENEYEYWCVRQVTLPI